MFSFLNKLFNRKPEDAPKPESPETELVQAAPESIDAPTENEAVVEVSESDVQPALNEMEAQAESETPTQSESEPETSTEIPTQSEPETLTETSAEETVQAAEPLLEPEPEPIVVPQESSDAPSNWATAIEENVVEKVQAAEQWAEGMAHAIVEKADELEMRGEILVEESSEALKTWAHGMVHAVTEKVDELEMRAEIVAEQVVDAVKETAETLEHALQGEDAPAEPELLPETEADDDMAPPPAEAASEIVDADDVPIAPVLHKETVAEHTTAETANSLHLTADAATSIADDNDAEAALGWTARLVRGLSKSRNQMAKSLAGVFGGGKIDEDLYEELETVLLTSDMGIEATEYLMNEVRKRVSLKGLKDGEELRQALHDALYDLLKPLEKPLTLPENKPFVIMMAGINGAGKTTSIGKLAKYFQAQGKSVMLAAGDTFRAAAREQLQEWGLRNNVTVISQAKGDSAAVCFDAVQSAQAKGIDVVLADTAGRLPTQLHLMEEIAKVKRVLQKAMPDAPHEIILVLDANIGQNALNQVAAFDKALGLTGLIVTKLDGTAKGGVLAALASNHQHIPVRYIGVGEGIDDLRPFQARDFVNALLNQ